MIFNKIDCENLLQNWFEENDFKFKNIKICCDHEIYNSLIECKLTLTSIKDEKISTLNFGKFSCKNEICESFYLDVYDNIIKILNSYYSEFEKIKDKNYYIEDNGIFGLFIRGYDE